MLRKIITIITLSAVCLLMAGCHLKEKIGENITEKAVEKAAGNGSDIDIDNGDVSIKSKDGEEVKVNDDGITINGKDGSVVQSGGEYEWPEGQAAAYVPEFKGGKITYILNSAESFLVYVEETKLGEFNDYVKAVAEKGYTADIIRMMDYCHLIRFIIFCLADIRFDSTACSHFR